MPRQLDDVVGTLEGDGPVDSPDLNTISVWCEVCGEEADYKPSEAFHRGWDFAGPGGMYPAGVITPRTCPDCRIEDTTWWRLVILKVPAGDLTPHDRAVIARIRSERPPG